MVQQLRIRENRKSVVTFSGSPIARILPKAEVEAEKANTTPKKYITKDRYQFVVHTSFDSLDKGKLKSLLEASFGKRLAPNYFEGFVSEIIVEKDYKAVAILKLTDGMIYLDKIAVLPELRGNGIGKTIWGILKEKYGSFMWRAGKTNDDANGWYFKECSGLQKAGGWIIFWLNVPIQTAVSFIDSIAALPPTMI